MKITKKLLVTIILIISCCSYGATPTLLDNYDGSGGLTYTTEDVGVNYWEVTGGEYEGKNNALATPNHSFASYDLSGSITGWDLDKSKENCWFGWLDLNRDSVSGWGTANYSCGMVLVANSSDLNANSVEGYAVGLRNSPDDLVIFKFNNGIQGGTTDLPSGSTEIIDSGYTYSDGDNGVNFYVEYLSDGKWKIYYKSGAQLSDADAVNKANYNGGNATSSSADETYTGTTYKYSGWIYAHNSGAGQESYFDNFGAGQVTASGPDNPTFNDPSVISSSQINLGWSKNGDDDDVMVARNTTDTFGTPVDGASFTTDVIYNGSGDSFSDDTGLLPNTEYYYKSWSVNASTEYSSGTATKSATTDNLPAPTGLGTDGKDDTSIDIYWTAVSGATKYFIDVATDDHFTEGGGTEDFANYTVSGSTYVDGTFTGSDGSTWTYNQCRGNIVISAPTPCLKNLPTAEVYSGTIEGGCKVLSFDYMQAFSTDVNLDVYVNDNLKATVTSSGEQSTVKSSGSITVNESGDFVLKFIQNSSGSGQVAIDNVVWTGGSFVGVYDNYDAGNVIIETIETLTANTDYYIRLRAYSATSTSADSDTLGPITTTPEPALFGFIGLAILFFRRK